MATEVTEATENLVNHGLARIFTDFVSRGVLE